MKDVDKLFGVFRRLHSTDEYEGTGIGLAIAKATAQALGGSISAETADGRSIVFKVVL